MQINGQTVSKAAPLAFWVRLVYVYVVEFMVS